MEIEVIVDEDRPVSRITFDPDWLDEWISAERARLLAPLAPPKPSAFPPGLARSISGLDSSIYKANLRAMKSFGVVEHEETRSEDEFHPAAGG